MTKTDTVYFEKGGKIHSEKTYKLAKVRADQLNIKNVFIASVRGRSAELAMSVFEGTDITLWFVGCNHPTCNGCPRFSLDIKDKVEKAGHKVIFAPEGSIPYPDAAALAYRRICEGLKVAVYLAMAAAEQQLVPIGEEIIAIGGTGWKGYKEGGGSDTAVVIQAITSQKFFTYDPLPVHKVSGRKIKEIICRPR